jgi:hypothetical protein
MLPLPAHEASPPGVGSGSDDWSGETRLYSRRHSAPATSHFAVSDAAHDLPFAPGVATGFTAADEDMGVGPAAKDNSLPAVAWAAG